MARNSYFNENTLEELLEEIKYVYQSDKRPWVIGYSGGKDSTTVVELVYKMLQMLPKEERNKNVYIVSSDTLIENPLIKIYLSKMNKLLGEAAKKDDLPIISTMVTPPADNSFWANVIGRGFPTPRINGTFRWCTDRLKINPSANYIRNVIKKEGEEVVVLLGVRKAESEARRRRIEGRELANRLMNRHETIQDAYVYNPIVELTTEDVWEVLLRLDGGKTPWGSNNNELVSLYAGADSGECPFAGIHAGGQTQSCGNSRFGCWVCTAVKEDKSLNGFIKSGHRELIPLAEFRSWLMSIRDNEEYREKKRRNGTVYRDKQGNMGFGPFNWKARKLILRRLLETQQVVGVNPDGEISVEEITSAIKENTALVSMIYVNNEIGTISDVESVAEICNKNNIALHSDLTQALGKIEIDVKRMGIDYASCSAHKIYGPKGIGAAFMKSDAYGIVPITAFMHGGEQEFGFRAGTHAVHNIVGFGKAAEIALRDLKKNEAHIKSLDDMLIAGISTIDGIHATVDISKRLPGIVSLVVDKKNFHNERFIKKISEEVALSTGSACSAGEPSYVIQALGLANEVTKVLRVSINKYTTEDDINSFLSLLKTI